MFGNEPTAEMDNALALPAPEECFCHLLPWVRIGGSPGISELCAVCRAEYEEWSRSIDEGLPLEFELSPLEVAALERIAA